MIVVTTQDGMRDKWTSALQRANARASVAKKIKATQTAANTGELKSDKGYYEWEDKWKNYVSTIPGQNGIPLSYVTRI